MTGEQIAELVLKYLDVLATLACRNSGPWAHRHGDV